MPKQGDLLAISISVPDGRVHSASLGHRPHKVASLGKLQSLLQALQAEVGDLLCFEPAGPLAAKASIIKAAAVQARQLHGLGAGAAWPAGRRVCVRCALF